MRRSVPLTVVVLYALLTSMFASVSVGAAAPSDSTWPRLSDYYAHTDSSGSTGSRADVINVIVYGPHLNSLGLPQKLWSEDTQYSSSYAKIPNINSYRNFDYIRTTDNNVFATRNHARIWVDANCGADGAENCVQELYITTSIEYACGSGHCIVPNAGPDTGGKSGYELGRDGWGGSRFYGTGPIEGLVPAMQRLANANHWDSAMSSFDDHTKGFVHHNGGIGPYSTATTVDGNVAVICIDPNHTNFCSNPPLAGQFVTDSDRGTVHLAGGQSSGTITATFKNVGFQPWRASNVYLAAYSTKSANPVRTAWCNPGDNRFVGGCDNDPTIIKLPADCQPNQQCTFSYSIRAPGGYTPGTVLYWRVAWRDSGGGFHWITGLNGPNDLQEHQYKVVP